MKIVGMKARLFQISLTIIAIIAVVLSSKGIFTDKYLYRICVIMPVFLAVAMWFFPYWLPSQWPTITITANEIKTTGVKNHKKENEFTFYSEIRYSAYIKIADIKRVYIVKNVLHIELFSGKIKTLYLSYFTKGQIKYVASTVNKFIGNK